MEYEHYIPGIAAQWVNSKENKTNVFKELLKAKCEPTGRFRTPEIYSYNGNSSAIEYFSP
jgi:hypothetical protein